MTTAGQPEPIARNRRKHLGARLSTFGHAATLEFLFLLALAAAMAGVAGTLAELLTDVRFDIMGRAYLLQWTLGVFTALSLAILLEGTLFPWSGRRSLRATLRRVRQWGSVFVSHLGLLPSRRQSRKILAIGAVAATVAFVVACMISLVPGIEQIDHDQDARYVAVANAPGLAGALYFAIAAPPPEEAMYRGLLLLIAAAATWWCRTPAARRLIIGVALVLTSAHFGYIHLEWSQSNAIMAATSGLAYGAAALWSRSLWAAVLAHALYNFAVGAVTI
ncbi:type II CAAX endopeptidase family protein [Isoptericola sp. F-RaC21]|uniref:CPBP family intramembrane glutamic endopeptidase n=1 Tax=Isoptericola sp. F-RaC21 TaxID=3141452 RepID=UPI00315BE38A